MITGDIKEVEDGFKIIAEKRSELKGINLHVEKTSGKLEVIKNKEGYIIKYDERVQFFRGISILLENIEKKECFLIKQYPRFKSDGVMIDSSRNGVLTVEGIKKIIEIMALMGLNLLMLYTEDTYEVENMPYFGYLRGRYTYNELRECDDYAFLFGIEMIPCIQVLSHLYHMLKWDEMSSLADTPDTLLADNEKTYEKIENMIKAATAPYRSNRIHIGMDEATCLGRGNYLANHEPTDIYSIFVRYLKRVSQIVEHLGLNAMIWSDTYIRAATENSDYWAVDEPIKRLAEDDIPENIQLVYWCYIHMKYIEYQKMLQKHKKLNRKVAFCGSVWTCGRLIPNYAVTFQTMDKALKACKNEKITDVFMAAWGDDGQETNIFSTLLAFQLYAEHNYNDEIDDELLKRRFKACTGCEYQGFLALSKIDLIDSFFDGYYKNGAMSFLKKCKMEAEGISENPIFANPSKYLLWQDIMLGVCDTYASDLQDKNKYIKIADELALYKQTDKDFAFVYEVPQKICMVLDIKATLGVRLSRAYHQNDCSILKEIVENQLDELYERVESLRESHMKQWLLYYKPFGWEVLDIRYGGLLARIKSTKNRLADYLNGKIDKLPEFEEKRLPYQTVETGSGLTHSIGNYTQLSSACN